MLAAKPVRFVADVVFFGIADLRLPVLRNVFFVVSLGVEPILDDGNRGIYGMLPP